MGVVAHLVVKVSANLSDFDKQLAGLERSLGRTGAKFQSIGRDLTVGLTLPIVGAAAVAVKAASDFESSFAGVRKTVDGVVDAGGNLTGFGKKLQGEFRELAKEIPISVNELNRIGESAGQLGIQGENIISFTKTIAAMGVATNLSSEEAAVGMARFAAITQMPQANIERLGSVIVELGNNLETTEAEILEFGLRIAGAGEIVGLTEHQILGIGAAFSSVGIEAEAGGTAVQKALLLMNSAVTSGKGLEAFGGAAFAQQFQSDPGEAFAGFIDKVGAAGKGGEQFLRDAGIDDARQIRAFLSMAAAGDKLRDSLKMASAEWVTNTALAREAEQRYRTFESQLVKLNNVIYDMRITFGTVLIESFLRMKPAIENVLGAVAGAVEWFSRLSPSTQTAAFAIGGLVAALGPLSYIFGTILTTGAGLLGLFRTVGLASAGTGAGVATATGAFAALGAVLAPLTVALGGFYVAYRAASDLDQFTIGGLRPSEWIEFLSGWRFGLSGVSAENMRLAITSRRVAEANAEIAGMVNQLRAQADARINSTALQVPGIPEDANPFGDAFTEAGFLSPRGGGLPAAAAQISEFERAVRSLTERLSGSGLVDTANQWVEAIGRIGGIGNLTHDELTQFQEDISAAVEKMRLMGEEVPRTWALIADSMRNAQALAESQAAIGRFFEMNRQQLLLTSSADSPQTDMLRGLMGGPASLAGSQGVSQQANALGLTFGASLSQGMRTSFASLPQIILGAFQGGGNVAASIFSSIGGTIGETLSGSIGKMLSGTLGKTLGGAIGGIMGPLGAMLGPLVGELVTKLGKKVWNGIQSIFGTDEEARDVNPARDAFLAQFGSAGTGDGSGFANLAAQLSEITQQAGGGALFQALTAADTMEEFNAAVTQIQTALQSASAGVTNTTTATDGLNLSLQGSDEAIAALGTTQERVVAAMLAGFDSLIVKLNEFIAAMGVANALSLPSVPSVAGPALDGTAPLDVPSFANEGVVSNPTLAWVGDAPEPEFILRKSTVEGLARAGVGGGGGRTIVQVIGNIPRDWIRVEVLDGIKRGGKDFSEFQGLVAAASQG